MTINGGGTQPAAEESWPAGEERRPAGEQSWWKLLRRAFGIPDIVSSKNSKDAVTTALLNLSPLTSAQNGIWEAGEREIHADTVVQTIVDMGDNGELDELFVPLTLDRKSKDAIRAMVSLKVQQIETEAFVDLVLTRVTACVKGPESQGPLEAD